MGAAVECTGQLKRCSIIVCQLKAAAALVLLLIPMLAAALAITTLFWSQLWLLLWLVAAAETAFAGYYFLVLVREFNHVPDQQAPAGHDPAAVIKSFLAHIQRVDDMPAYLSAWFLDAPFDSIKLDNVKELCAYAIFYKTPQQMEEAGLMSHLDDLMQQLQAMHKLTLPPGYNPDLRFMSHLWDEVPHIYRPLFFYLVMELLEVVCWGMLTINGFKRQQIMGCVYYTKGLPPAVCPQHRQRQLVTDARSAAAQQKQQKQQQRAGGAHQVQGQQQQQRHHNNKKQRQRSQHFRGSCREHQTGAGDVSAAAAARASQAAQQPAAAAATSTTSSSSREDVSSIPLVLLHGVGAGLLPYLGVIFLLQTTGRPMILPVWKHVSMRLTRNIPTVDDGADVTLAAMARHGVSRAAIIGHSYGTCIAARIVKTAPEVVHTLALIDPVCFAMYMPNLVKFFLYSAHVSGSRLADLLIALLSSELHCARNFCRNFFWTSINLWDEHLPDRTLVVLSGCDILCPTLYVRHWLENHTTAKVLYNPVVAHGAGLLLSPAWQRTIMQHMLQLLQSPSSAQAVAATPAAASVAGGEKASSYGGPAAAAAAEVVAGSAAAGGTSRAGTEAAARSSPGSVAATDAAVAEDDAGCDWGQDAFITGLDAAIPDLDGLWEATNSFVAGWVSVLRSSSSTLHQRRPWSKWDGAVGGAGVERPCHADAAAAGVCDQHVAPGHHMPVQG